MPDPDQQQPIARLMGLTIDVVNLEAARDFWKAALGLSIQTETEDWVIFAIQPGIPGLSLQRVSEPKEKKNRVHPDLKLADDEAGVKQLVALGAQTVREVKYGEAAWHIMLDPDGNEFCAIQ